MQDGKVDLAIYIVDKSRGKNKDPYKVAEEFVEGLRRQDIYPHSIKLEDFYTVLYVTKHFGYDNDLKEESFRGVSPEHKI